MARAIPFPPHPRRTWLVPGFLIGIRVFCRQNVCLSDPSRVSVDRICPPNTGFVRLTRGPPTMFTCAHNFTPHLRIRTTIAMGRRMREITRCEIDRPACHSRRRCLPDNCGQADRAGFESLVGWLLPVDRVAAGARPTYHRQNWRSRRPPRAGALGRRTPRRRRLRPPALWSGAGSLDPPARARDRDARLTFSRPDQSLRSPASSVPGPSPSRKCGLRSARKPHLLCEPKSSCFHESLHFL